MLDSLAAARTLLFVPGDRPERFEKAANAGADVVILDLEDAVAPVSKDGARANVVRALKDSGRASLHVLAVRINGPGTSEGAEDLDALSSLGSPVAVMLPKAQTAGEIRRGLGRLVAGSVIIALIETAQGVLAVNEIAQEPGVARLAFGHLDLCAELGLSPEDDDSLWPMRAGLLLASAANNLPAPIDGVTPDLVDRTATARDAARAARTGFGGKLCIHPKQVETIHEAFQPSVEDLSWARRVLASIDSTGLGTLDGQMVDRPVVLRARSVVVRAEGRR